VIVSRLPQSIRSGVIYAAGDTHGHTDGDLAEGVAPSSMPHLAEWTVWADLVITF
jgi:sulfur relay (sulfurtransferase) complex TusBCD TusD component (DsrE family)